MNKSQKAVKKVVPETKKSKVNQTPKLKKAIAKDGSASNKTKMPATEAESLIKGRERRVIKPKEQFYEEERHQPNKSHKKKSATTGKRKMMNPKAKRQRKNGLIPSEARKITEIMAKEKKQQPKKIEKEPNTQHQPRTQQVVKIKVKSNAHNARLYKNRFTPVKQATKIIHKRCSTRDRKPSAKCLLAVQYDLIRSPRKNVKPDGEVAKNKPKKIAPLKTKKEKTPKESKKKPTPNGGGSSTKARVPLENEEENKHQHVADELRQIADDPMFFLADMLDQPLIEDPRLPVLNIEDNLDFNFGDFNFPPSSSPFDLDMFDERTISPFFQLDQPTSSSATSSAQFTTNSEEAEELTSEMNLDRTSIKFHEIEQEINRLNGLDY